MCVRLFLTKWGQTIIKKAVKSFSIFWQGFCQRDKLKMELFFSLTKNKPMKKEKFDVKNCEFISFLESQSLFSSFSASRTAKKALMP